MNRQGQVGGGDYVNTTTSLHTGHHPHVWFEVLNTPPFNCCLWVCCWWHTRLVDWPSLILGSRTLTRTVPSVLCGWLSARVCMLHHSWSVTRNKNQYNIVLECTTLSTLTPTININHWVAYSSLSRALAQGIAGSVQTWHYSHQDRVWLVRPRHDVEHSKFTPCLVILAWTCSRNGTWRY